MPRLGSLTVMALVGLGSCGVFTEVSCDTGISPAVEALIRDAATGAPLAAEARGAVEEGTFIDSLRPGESNAELELISRVAADERPGRYTVKIEHAGYERWQGIAWVRRNDCGAVPVTLTAELEPLPAGSRYTLSPPLRQLGARALP